MDTSPLPANQVRQELHELIDHIADVDVLRAVKLLLAPRAQAEPVGLHWDELPAAEKQAIDAGLAQADSGQLMPWREALQRLG